MEERIPFEPDTHFFFKDYDNNIDVTKRDRRYLESISHKENSMTVQKEDDKILVTDSASGKKEYYYPEKYHKDVVSKDENLVNEYKDKVKKLDEVISKLKNQNDEKENLWHAEKQRIVNELQQLAGKYDSESSRNIILELEKRLEAEEKQHNSIIADYTESINDFKNYMVVI